MNKTQIKELQGAIAQMNTNDQAKVHLLLRIILRTSRQKVIGHIK